MFILFSGNLLKHYKERHPNSTLPEALAELDRVVTVGMSKTIPPEERGLGGANGFYDSNDSTYLEEEQMNKSMVSVIYIVLLPPAPKKNKQNKKIKTSMCFH